ncbi:MAG: amidase [Actinomycetota bacterium]
MSADIPLEGATIDELGAGLREGRFGSRRLTEAYLERIRALDGDGPTLRSVIELNPDAIEIAEARDRERAEAGSASPLHGIPILIKDNIDTADAMHTTAGSLALLDSRPPRDAALVERLRGAGAIVLGKTNLSEWANWRSGRSSSGWSAVGGQCVNPYALDRSPCGSSSGSGVAVAADLCAAAIGTETDGSIVCPASANGIVGIKPTRGRISGAGIVPIAHSQDTAGPMARTVADAAALLSAIAETGFDVTLDPAALRGARIGVARNLAGFHDRVDALFEDALAVLRGLGAEVVDPANVPHVEELEKPELEVLMYEFKADIASYLSTRSEGTPRTLADLIAFNRAHAEEELGVFGQDLFEASEAKGPLTEQAYVVALATCGRLSREEGLDAVFAEHRLDAIVQPTRAPAWLIDHVNGDASGGGDSAPAAVSGYPSITVPMGFVSGLPVGLSFTGRAWSESTIIGFAYAFERETGQRRPPRFLPSVGPSVGPSVRNR